MGSQRRRHIVLTTKRRCKCLACVSSPLLLCGNQLFTPRGPHDLPRVTVHSVGRLGRGCTLTRSCIRISSHTTASTCCTGDASLPCGITACIQGRLTLKSARYARLRLIAVYTALLTRSIARLHLYEARPRKSTKEPKRSHHSTRPIPSVYNGVWCRAAEPGGDICLFVSILHYTRTSCQPLLQLLEWRGVSGYETVESWHALRLVVL